MRFELLLLPALLLLMGCDAESGSAPATDTAAAEDKAEPDSNAGGRNKAGSGNQAEKEATSDGDATSADAPAGEIGEAAKLDVALQVAPWQQVQEWVAKQQGKVVVVDVWSTYCRPCMVEFPHFLELCGTFPQRVSCAAVSIDYYGKDQQPPESVQQRVRTFLEKQKSAATANFLASDQDQHVLDEIGVAAIPATLVYDQQGNLIKTFSNDDNQYGSDGYTYEQHVTPLVRELLGAAGSPGEGAAEAEAGARANGAVEQTDQEQTDQEQTDQEQTE